MKGTERNVALVIIFSLITCGLYSLYWMAVTHDEVNAYLGEDDISGPLVVLFSILTCGIYSLVWYYRMGEKVEQAQIKANGYGNNDAVLYLILSIFGLSLVTDGIIQSNLNKAWQN